MNRRGFFGFLAAAPVAAVAGLRSRGPIGWWGRVTIKRARKPSMTPKQWAEVVGESTERMADEMSAAAEEMGSSFNFIKSRTASEIMAKADRRALRKP